MKDTAAPFSLFRKVRTCIKIDRNLLQTAFVKYVHAGGHSSGTKTSSFNLRLILWEAGITVSNKVLECLVLRFSKNKLLSSESYVTVMVRLHLAHGEPL